MATTVDRRRFLTASAIGAAQAALIGSGLAGCTTSALTPDLTPAVVTPARADGPLPARADGVEGHPFQHGVASGDPLSDRVILWARVTPRPHEEGAVIAVRWWIARDPGGRARIASGETKATPDRDYTVKIDATGLAPASEYFYGFEVGDPRSKEGRFRSTLGRTRTAAASGFEPLRFAAVACSNYPAGFFNAYAAIAKLDDLDFVVHLGDYIYEYVNGAYGDGTAIGRIPDPARETVRLDDYRRRHATYKRDPDLQAAHARHPWIVIWDDHEIADNAWATGALNHQPDKGEGEWSARRLAAVRAYYEWMPIRELPSGLFRHFRFGELADLIMLDARLAGRDPQVAATDHEGANDPKRSILGLEQEERLFRSLDESSARAGSWKILGQQSPFSPLTDGIDAFNPDSWDGYRASRRRLLGHLEENSIEGVLFLSGDYHSSWAFEVPPPIPWPGAASATPSSSPSPSLSTTPEPQAIEAVVPAVSSPPSGSSERARTQFEDSLERHPHLRFLDVVHQGFVQVELDRERARIQWTFTGDRRQRSSRTECGAVFESRYGTNRLVRVDEAECGD